MSDARAREVLHPELDMDWIHLWSGLGWIGSGFSGIFMDWIGLDWI